MGADRVNLLSGDLDHILEYTEDFWDSLRGERLFITGGTGFFGKWLLESFVYANEKKGLNASAVVLTRDPASFRRKMPHLADSSALEFLQGDVRTFEFPEGNFPFIIHAATDASTVLNQQQPLLMLDTITEGTRHTLEFARRCGTKRFLVTSSGAIYGKQPPELSHVPESYMGSPDLMAPDAAYGEGKRYAEALCSFFGSVYGFDTIIARCFAFIGPYLPLDQHFAAGNFIRDALSGRAIQIAGDGTPYRSYLYAADLMIWLWTMLHRAPSSRAYNVGAEETMTIAEIAESIARQFTARNIRVQTARQPVPGQPANRYVPSTERARNELGLHTLIPIEKSIEKTVSWYRQQI